MAMNLNNQMNFPETTETTETTETPETTESPIHEPGGFTAISRGLRSNSDDTPGPPTPRVLHPSGMPALNT